MPYADASTIILLRASEDRIKTAEDLSGKILGIGAREAVLPADERGHALDQRKIFEKKGLPVHWLAASGNNACLLVVWRF